MLDGLRATARARLKSDCTVSTRAAVSDRAGGTVVSWTTKETTRCDIFVITSSADVPDDIMERIGNRQAYRFKLPYDSTVSAGDRLTVDGRLFDVLSAPRASSAVSVRGLCVEA